MKGIEIFAKVVGYGASAIRSKEFEGRSKKRKEDFTRKRKMGFIGYMVCIIHGVKQSLQAGLNAFFEEMGKQETDYSKQAFSKGRKRIKPEAFLELFRGTGKVFYQETEGETCHGKHMLGIDGTKLNLPNTKELRELYGEQKSSGAPQVQALVSCLYDLLNGMILDVRFSPCTDDEQTDAMSMIKALDYPELKNSVFIMDRGYPSVGMIEFLEQGGYYYVMRCSKTFIQEKKLSTNDQTLNYHFSKANKTFRLRIVRFPLNDGTTEILITNLFDPDLTTDDFKEIYHMRWGIETKYNDIKNKIQIENFSGTDPDAVLQDFYASMFIANLAGALEYDMRDNIRQAHSNPENKYQYRMNMNIAIAELKTHVIEMCITDSALRMDQLLRHIQRKLIKAVCPVRPNRSAPRDRQHKSSKFPVNMKSPS